MKTTYNGKKNYAVIRDFHRLCKICDENRQEVMEALKKNGSCWIQTNLCPFTGCADEFTKNTPITSEDEANEFLKKDFEKRFKGYVKNKDMSDPLLTELYSFITTNMHWPSKDEMKTIEEAAEVKRLETSDEKTEEITMAQLIKNEIMQLAIEIYTITERNNPKDISNRVEPYPSILHVLTENADMYILYERWYPSGFVNDYRMHASIKGENGRTNTISIIAYTHDLAELCSDNYSHFPITERNSKTIIILHKELSKIAREKGFEFTTEVDYDKIIEA